MGQGAWSREHGAWSREHGAGGMEPRACGFRIYNIEGNLT